MSKPTHIVDKLRNQRTRVYLPEILEAADKEIAEGNRDTAISLLQTYNAKNQEHANRLRDYIQCLYHPAVKLDLPDVPPPFDDTQYIDFDFAPLTLEKAMQRVKYYVVGHSAYIEKTSRRELMFIQTLESLQKRDAELYISILLKKFPVATYPNINIGVFNEALPQYFTGINVDEIAKRESPEHIAKVNAIDNVLQAIVKLDTPVELDEVPVPKAAPVKKTPVKAKAPAKKPTPAAKKPAAKKTPTTGKASTTAKKAPVKRAPAKKKDV